MNDLFNIKDYVVVITGGTGVLGRTIAKYLAGNGAQVVILGRKEEVGKEIVDGIVRIPRRRQIITACFENIRSLAVGFLEPGLDGRSLVVSLAQSHASVHPHVEVDGIMASDAPGAQVMGLGNAVERQHDAGDVALDVVRQRTFQQLVYTFFQLLQLTRKLARTMKWQKSKRIMTNRLKLQVTIRRKGRSWRKKGTRK